MLLSVRFHYHSAVSVHKIVLNSIRRSWTEVVIFYFLNVVIGRGREEKSHKDNTKVTTLIRR